MQNRTSFRWDDLQVFLAAWRTRRMAEAAQHVGVDASTISRRLAVLEESLQISLFDRTPEGLVPTDAARSLLPAAEMAEEAALRAQTAMAGYEREPEGVVKLAVADGMATHLLAPVMPQFFARYPRVKLEISGTPGIADLTRREADIAVRHVRPQRGDLVARQVTRSGYGVFASRDYAESHAGRPAEQLDWITWTEELAHLQESRWHATHIGGTPRLRSRNLATMVAAARAGAGVVLLADGFTRLDASLVRVPVDPEPDLDAEIWLVAHRALREVPRVQAVWGFLDATLTWLAAQDGPLETLEAPIPPAGPSGIDPP
ncbi:MAG: LysR family transcriptional regulator [Myxococcota bacterium]